VRLWSPFLGVILAVASQTGCGSGVSPPAQPTSSDASSEITAGENDGNGAQEAAAGDDSQAGGQTAQGPAPGNEARDDRILTPEQLIAALRQKNPGFDGVNIAMRPISADLLEMGINDPTVKDISPLRKQRIAKLDLRFCDLTDLSPLEGMPLSELYLEENRRLRDLSPLRGMPLHKLYLTNTAVENLGPLRGAPLIELNAVGAKIKNLEPLSQSPLQMLWLTDCPVSDISPLQETPLVSLTLENTPVSDLSPLAGHPLQRLHIAGTGITDLTPVGQMQLRRLIFTPDRIETGLDIVRNAESIGELGSNFDNRMPPGEFWELFDDGKLNE
jgi:hypothetical protein